MTATNDTTSLHADTEHDSDNPDLEPPDYDEAADERRAEAEHEEWLASLPIEAHPDDDLIHIEIDDEPEGFTFEADGSVSGDDGANGPSHFPEWTKNNSWWPRSMAELIADAKTPEPEPKYLRRTDGVSLLYRGKLSSIAGEPESCKGWLACLAAAQVLKSGAAVLYVDFEDDDVGIVRRLRALGVEDAVLRAQCMVMHPMSTSGWFASKTTNEHRAFQGVLTALAKRGLGLLVFDGVTSALSLDGLDPNNNAEVVKWINFCASLCRKHNCAGLLVDHVTKTNPKDRYASGAGQKLAGITGSQFKAEYIGAPFSEASPGYVRISVTKDRPGKLRKHAFGKGHVQAIADMHLEVVNESQQQIRAWLDKPAIELTDSGEMKLTALQGRIGKYLQNATTPRSTSDIKAGVKGQDKQLLAALNQMVDDGRVVQKKGERGAKVFELVGTEANADD